MKRHSFPAVFVALLGISVICPAVAQGELVFSTTRVELHAEAADEIVYGTFHFKNRGFDDEEIIEIESSCGCLSASMDKKKYAPGESGKLRAAFKLSNFVGTHEKLLTVRTANPKSAPVDLEVQINVPEIIRTTPEIHEWTLKGDSDTRKYTVEILGDDPIKITDISATRTNVDYKINILEEGRKYENDSKPHDTEKVTMGAVRLTTDSTIPKFQRKMLFFAISPEKKKTGGS